MPIHIFHPTAKDKGPGNTLKVLLNMLFYFIYHLYLYMSIKVQEIIVLFTINSYRRHSLHYAQDINYVKFI